MYGRIPCNHRFRERPYIRKCNGEINHKDTQHLPLSSTQTHIGVHIQTHTYKQTHMYCKHTQTNTHTHKISRFPSIHVELSISNFLLKSNIYDVIIVTVDNDKNLCVHQYMSVSGVAESKTIV